eukprot:391814-Prymnesium_polylepis.1
MAAPKRSMGASLSNEEIAKKTTELARASARSSYADSDGGGGGGGGGVGGGLPALRGSASAPLRPPAEGGGEKSIWRSWMGVESGGGGALEGISDGVDADAPPPPL